MANLTQVQRLRRRKAFFSWSGALLLTVVILLGNYILSYVPLRLDTTEGSKLSLSSGSKKLLKDLDDTLLVRLMFSSHLPPQFKLNEQYIRDILSEYKRASGGKIRIEYFDPGESPKNRQEAMVAGVMPVQLDVRERDRREVKESFMGISFMYGDKKEAIPFVSDTNGLEYEITQRIKKLIHPGDTKIGVVKNGRALDFMSEPLRPLGEAVKQLYSVVDVDLTTEIPADIKSLWLFGPTDLLTAPEVDRLRNFVKGGGSLGLLIDNYTVNIQMFRPGPIDVGLTDLLKEWGIDFRKGLVVDERADRIQIRSTQGVYQMINIVDYPYFPLVTDLNREHPASKQLDAISFPFVSPVVVDREIPGLTYTPLAKSSKQSWLDEKTLSVSPLQGQARPEDAVVGPFNLGLLIEGKFSPESANTGRVMLFGTSRFIRTDYPPRQNNYTFLVNLFDWSSQDEILLSIRSKGMMFRPLKPMTETSRAIIKYLIVLFLPIMTLVAGFLIWKSQRRRLAFLPQIYKEA